MAKKLRVGVIFGGRSGEHEISLRSARSVIEAMDKDKYEVVPVAINKEGKWLAPAEAIRLLPETTTEQLSRAIREGASSGVAIIGDPSRRGLVTLDAASGDERPAQPLDVVFPVLHGTYGEDGTIQGLLEMAGVAYVGCGVLASSCGMDKVTMKALFRDAGLPMCQYTWLVRSEWEREPEKVLRRISRQLGFPCFVKPANLGSSVGISRAVDKSSLERAINLAARYDRKIIVEEAVDAREIECAVIGNDEPEASLPGEYVVHDEAARFLDYTEKYSSTGHVEFVVPAPLSKSLTARLRRMATKAFKAVDGAGFARVDFFLRRDTGELIINELNTIPGLTDVSGYPKMWAASGLPFPQVIDRLIELAIERHTEKARNETSL
ncbi:MAG TPA: D-alanine--D-alanine ligase family protein [Pyrinomonadaceae bacterium]|jgi:D-alanine-D-alanine ligase|nr:D-alanine--D-alanine ligase family protein [Pyrinomonadaceae bacterium]